MHTLTLPLELITTGICGGANPAEQAEIRVPSIRGQLRWWFRVLGGVAGDSRTIRAQEDGIFGRIHETPHASPLRFAVANAPRSRDARFAAPSNGQPAAKNLGAPMGSSKGYLLFPLREKVRGVFTEDALPKFDLRVQWLGDAQTWQTILALLRVFAELGSLGSRSRRTMGALALRENVPALPPLRDSLLRFSDHGRLQAIILPAGSRDEAVTKLSDWLKSWRAHGRSVDHIRSISPNPPYNVGFKYAKNDHDAGAQLGLNRYVECTHTTYRPALGLPILQFFSGGNPQIDWNETFNKAGYKGEGRFASPVLLRPRRITSAHTPGVTWQALVLFVDARAWPKKKMAYLSSPNDRGIEAPVSLDLYEEMKLVRASLPFPQPAAAPAATIL